MFMIEMLRGFLPEFSEKDYTYLNRVHSSIILLNYTRLLNPHTLEFGREKNAAKANKTTRKKK